MTVYYNDRALLHTFNRHHIEKHHIEEAISSGIEKMVYQKVIEEHKAEDTEIYFI